MAGFLSSLPTTALGAAVQDGVPHSEALGRWMQCTQAGNDAYDSGRWACSLGLHTQALWLAEGLCKGRALQGCPHECLASLLVSHHNVADVHWARGDTVAAVSQWLSVRDALLPVLRSTDVPETVQHTVHRYLRVTQSVLDQWQHWLQQPGERPAGCRGCPLAMAADTPNAEPGDPVNPHRLPMPTQQQ